MLKYCCAAAILVVAAQASGKDHGVACLGQVVAGDRSLTLAAPAGSVVSRLLVKRGELVESGAELARLRDYEICEEELALAGQNIVLAQASLALVAAGERNELVEAQKSLLAAHEASAIMHSRRKERYEALHTNLFVSLDQFEEVSNAYDLANAEALRAKSILDSLHEGRTEAIAEAAARVAVAESERDLAIARLEAQRIRAPMAGEILDIYAYDGEAVGEKGILDIADTSNMMILAEVYETDIARIRLGQKAIIRSPVFEGEIAGSVVEIQRQVENSRIFPLDPLLRSDRRIIPVRIKPDRSERLATFNNLQVTVILSP